MIQETVNQQVAKALRAARDLMNHGGKHWIKGTEKKQLENGEWGYCSIGGVSKVTRGHSWKTNNIYTAAILELAQTIDPKKMAKAEKEARKWVFESDDDFETNLADAMLNTAEDIIARKNDAKATKWADVRNIFTQTAKRVAARKT